MDLVENLMARASEYLPEQRVSDVRRAYAFAEACHAGQVRKSGDSFIEHPLHTALYLADLKLDADALSAALLHDVIEDCGVQYEELDNKFGGDVARLVDGVTKLNKADLLSETPEAERPQGSADKQARAATVRKMLMAMAEDVRVVLIKLADRLHNMRTLKALDKDRRETIAQETLDIYAPLAHRLGMWEIKWLLEDLSFQHLEPESYTQIAELVNSKRKEREEYIERVKSTLEAELRENGLHAEVKGRPKHFYSIANKMTAYKVLNKTVDEIYDLFALRILVEDVKDCYTALGVVHAMWRPLPGQFDDYIANPKDNLYQSLHTAVLCTDASPVEIQIRTYEMHRLAEYGVAAHWLYKEGGPADEGFEKKMTWLRQLLDWQRDVSGAEEFVESFKTDVFQNQVFVYTPKGDLKELPTGSTPLDFAYRVHTEVGHRCIGAKVNGKLVSLNTELQNGDTVDIMTSRTVRGPSMDWLNPNLGYIKTTSARVKVRQWFNRQARRASIQRGRDLFVKQLRRLNTDLDDQEVAQAMGLDSTDDFFAALGGGVITISDVVNKLSTQEVTPQQDHLVALPATGPASGIQVLGVGDLLTRMAQCCSPIRGDKITGYITRNRGVTVHRETCPNIVNESERERLVEVTWGQTQTLYPVRITIEAWDRVGLLRDVTSLVSEERVNIAACVSDEFDDTSVISLTVYTDGINQLSRLFSKLEGVEGVSRVVRAKSLSPAAASR